MENNDAKELRSYGQTLRTPFYKLVSPCPACHQIIPNLWESPTRPDFLTSLFEWGKDPLIAIFFTYQCTSYFYHFCKIVNTLGLVDLGGDGLFYASIETDEELRVQKTVCLVITILSFPVLLFKYIVGFFLYHHCATATTRDM